MCKVDLGEQKNLEEGKQIRGKQNDYRKSNLPTQLCRQIDTEETTLKKNNDVYRRMYSFTN